MKRAANLDQGNTAADPKNSPGPLPKQKRSNIARTAPTAKARNVPSPMSKNREGQTYRKNPTNTPPRDLPDDARIHRELTGSKGRPTGHSRKGN